MKGQEGRVVAQRAAADAATSPGLVRPEKADVSSGRQSHQGKSQKPCSWMAARRETE